MKTSTIIKRTQADILASLPFVAFMAGTDAGLYGDDERKVIKLFRGQAGYLIYSAAFASVEIAREVAKDFNELADEADAKTLGDKAIKRTPAVLEAMQAGSMFGWGVPAADPLNAPANASEERKFKRLLALSLRSRRRSKKGGAA